MNYKKVASFSFLICRNQHDDTYRLYQVDPEARELFTLVPLHGDASFDHSYRMAQVGGYLLQGTSKNAFHGIFLHGKAKTRF